jgi:two-component system chemotaxis response regulator CheB
MIVDDSAVVRGLVSRWIEEEPGLEVVSRQANGRLALDDVARSAPDIVLLDIEMPVMDGLEALPLLLEALPELRVLVVSTLTRRNAEISFKALALGALDYVPKPDSNREITTSLDFRREVIRKIKSLGRVQIRRTGSGEDGEPVASDAGLDEAPRRTAFKRRPFSLVPPRIVAIGSSTGGPEALALAPLHNRCPGFRSWWRSICRRYSPPSWPSVWPGPRAARPRKALMARRSPLARSTWRRATIT